MWGAKWVQVWGCLRAFHRVRWWQMVGSWGLSSPLVVCSLPFARSLALPLGASLANMALFRVLRAFLEGFSCSVWVCVVLVLFVACVGFVRVWS